MTQLVVEKDIVLKRLNGIQQEVAELTALGEIPFEEFQKQKGFELSQYHLHRALEGVFNIIAHILSRIPGAQATKYSELAQNFGKHRLIDLEFSQTKLIQMAKYRNRLVHFYAEVTPKEIYAILQHDLDDFDVFLSAVKNILEYPEKYGLRVE
ncbi:MAG: hypothetical protein G01um101433_572 [Parcubacteria group bacterium Gr01-1014_33]|nr:MAG: hypothetical protein G01um101433_572 [Parcubacteria group bacterium Gr01-1014_33]